LIVQNAAWPLVATNANADTSCLIHPGKRQLKQLAAMADAPKTQLPENLITPLSVEHIGIFGRIHETLGQLRLWD
jgi:hypothetical protein